MLIITYYLSTHIILYNQFKMKEIHPQQFFSFVFQLHIFLPSNSLESSRVSIKHTHKSCHFQILIFKNEEINEKF